MPFTRLLAITLTSCALTALAAAPAAADGWKQVGLFRSDTRNLAVGTRAVRVVSVPDTKRLGLSGDIREDRPIIEAAYPGWDLNSDLVVLYRATPAGFQQDTFYYETGADRQPFPGDPIAPNLSVYDRTGERRAKVPKSLRGQLGTSAQVVAAASADWDGDSEAEWAVVIAGTWDVDQVAAPMRVSLLDRSGDTWTVERTFDIKEKVRAGPLEIRDATGDGIPDVVFRCFHQTRGHYWVDAYIFSQHDEMPAKFLPKRFEPGPAIGPPELR
jgi:hypothetical protein